MFVIKIAFAWALLVSSFFFFFDRKSIEESTLVDIDIQKVRKIISWGKKKEKKLEKSHFSNKESLGLYECPHPYACVPWGDARASLLSCLSARRYLAIEGPVKLACLFLNNNENKHCYFQILDATFKECRKENPTYKMAALKCFGEIVQDYSIDRFQQISELLFPIIAPVSIISLSFVFVFL